MTAWPDADRVDRLRTEQLRVSCPLCARPALVEPGATMVDVTRRLARHLLEGHDPYFGAQLRAALVGYRDDEPAAEVFYPAGDAW